MMSLFSSRIWAKGGWVDRALVDAAYEHMLRGYHISSVAVPEDFLIRPDRAPLAYAVAREGVEIS
jgi:hypothetical protein